MSEQQKKKSSKFVSKSELAEKYGICVKTLNKYIARIQVKLPLYEPNDHSFSPAQVKVIDYHLDYYTGLDC
jgi:hypothetical protein